jgi:hypothetical protein
MAKMRNVYTILIGKLEKRLLGRPRRRWAVNIKVDLREIGMDGVDICNSEQGSVASCCEQGDERFGTIKGGDFLD